MESRLESDFLSKGFDWPKDGGADLRDAVVRISGADSVPELADLTIVEWEAIIKEWKPSTPKHVQSFQDMYNFVSGHSATSRNVLLQNAVEGMVLRVAGFDTVQSAVLETRRVGVPRHTSRQYDVFVSHAGKEKRECCASFYNILAERGLRVFFDVASRQSPGDIMNAAKNAPIGVFVISKEFVSKKWPLPEAEVFLERAKVADSHVRIISVFYGGAAYQHDAFYASPIEKRDTVETVFESLVSLSEALYFESDLSIDLVPKVAETVVRVASILDAQVASQHLIECLTNARTSDIAEERETSDDIAGVVDDIVQEAARHPLYVIRHALCGVHGRSEAHAAQRVIACVKGRLASNPRPPPPFAVEWHIAVGSDADLYDGLISLGRAMGLGDALALRQQFEGQGDVYEQAALRVIRVLAQLQRPWLLSFSDIRLDPMKLDDLLPGLLAPSQGPGLVIATWPERRFPARFAWHMHTWPSGHGDASDTRIVDTESVAARLFGRDLTHIDAVDPADFSLYICEGEENKRVVIAEGLEATKFLFVPRQLGAPGIRIIVAKGGLGKTRFLNSIAACHGSALLENTAQPFASVIRGFINGRHLRDNYKYARVFLIRLRDFRLLSDDSPFTKAESTVSEATAVAVARLLHMPTSSSGMTWRDLAVELFEQNTLRTLWLLDGFDEVPEAARVADNLISALKGAFEETRDGKLSAPSLTAAEIEFGTQLATSLRPRDRVIAVLRILLCQGNVILSTRPELESKFAPLTGYENARFARIEPLSTHAVRKFVRGALKVGKNISGVRVFSLSVWRTISPLITQGAPLRRVEMRMASNSALLEAMRTPMLMLIAIAAFRHSSDGGIEGLPPAPDGPSDVQLVDIDRRSPVAGLYVRAERVLAMQVFYKSAELAALRESRTSLWSRLRLLLVAAGLESCASETISFAWPSDYRSACDLDLLRSAHVVDVDPSGLVEFPHRSIQEFFAALSILQVERIRASIPTAQPDV